MRLTMDMAQLDISTMYFSDNVELTETAAGLGVFANGNYSVRIQEVFIYTSLRTNLVVSDGGLLTNTVFSARGAQPGVYRNYNEAIPTDLDPADLAVPDFVPWRLKIGGVDLSQISQACVTTTVDNVTVTFSPTRGSVLWSDQIFVLTPNGNLEAPLPQGYTQLMIDPSESKWWDDMYKDVFAIVTLDMGANIEEEMQKFARSQTGAVVLQSFRWFEQSEWPWGLDTETRICKPLLDMGYTVYRNYAASKSETLEDYIRGYKGREIFYSISHGGTVGGPKTPFVGLMFKEGKKDGVIRASDLSPLYLNYKLVILDACSTAQTSLNSDTDARDTLSPLLQQCKDFADAFGPNVAYMGWSWTMHAIAIQVRSNKLLNNLKFDPGLGRGRTVAEAYQKVLDDFIPQPKQDPDTDTRHMKIYGKTGHIIDKRKEAK